MRVKYLSAVEIQHLLNNLEKKYLVCMHRSYDKWPYKIDHLLPTIASRIDRYRFLTGTN